MTTAEIVESMKADEAAKRRESLAAYRNALEAGDGEGVRAGAALLGFDAAAVALHAELLERLATARTRLEATPPADLREAEAEYHRAEVAADDLRAQANNLLKASAENFKSVTAASALRDAAEKAEAAASAAVAEVFGGEQ